MINFIIYDDILKLEVSLYRNMCLSPHCDATALLEGRKRIAEVRVRRLAYMESLFSRFPLEIYDQNDLLSLEQIKSVMSHAHKKMLGFISQWPVEIAIGKIEEYRTASAELFRCMDVYLSRTSTLATDLIVRLNAKGASKAERVGSLCL